jgi:hypothetical protein
MHSSLLASRTRRATATVSWFTSQWRAGPKVSIAPTARHLPFDAPDDARGLHWRGEVHVVASQPADSLAQTMVHEAVGHFGMRELLGHEWPHFMRHIQLGIQERDPGLIKIQAHIRRAYVDDDGQFCLSPMQEADEIAAYVAEEILCMRTGEIRPARPWTQALEAVRGRLLREGLCLERAVTRSELEGMLFLAAKRMERQPWSLRERIGRAWGACRTMAAMFDPRKPPMRLEESERLLKAADDWESQKRYWRGSLGTFAALLWAVAKVAAACLFFFVLGKAIGNMPALVLGAAYFYFRDRLDQ